VGCGARQPGVAAQPERVVFLLDQPPDRVERLLVLQAPVEQLAAELVPPVGAQVAAGIELAEQDRRRVAGHGDAQGGGRPREAEWLDVFDGQAELVEQGPADGLAAGTADVQVGAAAAGPGRAARGRTRPGSARPAPPRPPASRCCWSAADTAMAGPPRWAAAAVATGGPLEGWGGWPRPRVSAGLRAGAWTSFLASCHPADGALSIRVPILYRRSSAGCRRSGAALPGPGPPGVRGVGWWMKRAARRRTCR
jgi:hypothetical protein